MLPHLAFPPGPPVDRELVTLGTAVDFLNVKDDEAPILPVTVTRGVILGLQHHMECKRSLSINSLFALTATATAKSRV